MADPVALPAPFLGVDQKTPVFSLQSPYCENMLNFNVTQAGVELRHGHSKYAHFSFTAGSPALSQVICLTPYGDTRLFLLAWNNFASVINIYDVDTGLVVHTSGAAASTANFYSLYFNRYQFWFSDSAIVSPGLYYNGSAGTFGNIGYTAGTGTPGTFTPIGGDVYNNRAYLIQRGAAGYWYTELYAISGACPYVDLATIISEEATLSIICPFTLSDQVSSVRIQAFVFSTGEVLFYTGSYPNSADWTIVGSAKIGQPLDYNSYVPYQGDSLVLCDSGVVSMRDLFLKGSQAAASLSVSDNINKAWSELVAAGRTFFSKPAGPLSVFISGVWDTKNDRIIIHFPFYLNSAGDVKYGGYFFVFDCQLKAWSFHKTVLAGSGSNSLSAIRDMARFKNEVLMCSQNVGAGSDGICVSEYEGATGFTDRNPLDTAEVTYDYEIQSAPLSTGRTNVQRVNMLEEIVNTDLYAQTSWQLIRDFGAQTTSAQVVTGAVSGSIQKTPVNLGIEGSFIQFKMSGTTTSSKTVGLELYGTNIWTEQGNRPR